MTDRTAAPGAVLVAGNQPGRGMVASAVLLFALITLALISSAASLHARQISGRLSTAVYGWERTDTGGVSETVLLGMQNIQLDASHGGFGVSASAYGSTLLTGVIGDQAEFRVRNLYARYASPGRGLEVKAGRVPIFAGVGVGAVDGAWFRLRTMERKVTLAAYGGSNVPGSLVYDHHRDLGNNFLLGAQITAEPASGTRVGLSYVNRRIEREPYETLRADSLFNPVTAIVSPGSRATQLLGADLWHTAPGLYELYGRYDRDLNLERTRRAEIGGRVVVLRDLTALANFLYREPSIQYNSWFTLFPLAPVREYEGGLEYAIAPLVRASAKVAYVGYETGNSRRLTLGVATTHASVGYSGANGYAGEMSSFSLQGSYPLAGGAVTPTAGAAWSSYRLSASSPDETAFSGVLGAIVRPTGHLTIEIQGQLLNNRILESDGRGFLRASYWFSHAVQAAQ